MTRVVKNRVYAALIAVSFIAGFYLDSPVKFLNYMVVVTVVVSLTVNAPVRQSRASGVRESARRL